MKHTAEFRPDEAEEKRSSKGFYIALALCLMAIVGVALVMFVDTDTPPVDTTPTSGTTRTTVVTTTAKPVAGIQTGVPDTRTTTTTKKTTTTTAAKSNLFVLPASNVILKEYSDQLVFSETLGEWRTHNGVDFEAQEGTAVKATADGTVLTIESDPLWGDILTIDHGDKLISRYCGVTASGVTVGKKVKAGEIIGTVSAIPAEIVDAPHLHLEIIANGKYLDPMTLIRTN